MQVASPIIPLENCVWADANVYVQCAKEPILCSCFDDSPFPPSSCNPQSALVGLAELPIGETYLAEVTMAESKVTILPSSDLSASPRILSTKSKSSIIL